ncbi:Os02g0510800 [Oryza sativa Japonica Group]|uniref:Os02g0510800 protein n=3 Tax=Oryza TaxID=4527 RepID=Q6K789_ORYSJ|nr:hypothetical protein [Oryza sativa Japonica Group]BAS78859.1 Os02g0510800 [Oryza sativa Japonica Group]
MKFSPDRATVGSSAVPGWSSGNGVGNMAKQHKMASLGGGVLMPAGTAPLPTCYACSTNLWGNQQRRGEEKYSGR